MIIVDFVHDMKKRAPKELVVRFLTRSTHAPY